MSDVYDGLEHFSRGEFEPHADEMKPVFLVKLDKARSIAGIPFHLKSSFREGDDKSHGRGYAGDVRIDPALTGVSRSRARYLIVRGALGAGFTRIGVYDRHVHLDCDPDLPPRVLWEGVST